jgi:hypothetical protein
MVVHLGMNSVALCTAQSLKNLIFVSVYNILHVFLAVMYICLVNKTFYLKHLQLYLFKCLIFFLAIFLPASIRAVSLCLFIYCKVLRQFLCFLSLNCLYLTFPGYKRKLASMRQWVRYLNITPTCRVLRFLVPMIHFRCFSPPALTAFMMVVFNHIHVVT